MRLIYLMLLILLFPTSVFAQPYRTVSYDEFGRKVITFTCDPNETPDWFKENYLKEEETEQKKTIASASTDTKISEPQRTPPRTIVSDTQDSVLGMPEDGFVR